MAFLNLSFPRIEAYSQVHNCMWPETGLCDCSSLKFKLSWGIRQICLFLPSPSKQTIRNFQPHSHYRKAPEWVACSVGNRHRGLTETATEWPPRNFWSCYFCWFASARPFWCCQRPAGKKAARSRLRDCLNSAPLSSKNERKRKERSPLCGPSPALRVIRGRAVGN